MNDFKVFLKIFLIFRSILNIQYPHKCKNSFTSPRDFKIETFFLAFTFSISAFIFFRDCRGNFQRIQINIFIFKLSRHPSITPYSLFLIILLKNLYRQMNLLQSMKITASALGNLMSKVFKKFLHVNSY